MRPPSECGDMAELRAEIDRVDRALIALLVARAGYIDRAIDLKADLGLPARIHHRVDEVLENARVQARAQGFDPDLAEALWSRIVEWSIAREERILGPDDDRQT